MNKFFPFLVSVALFLAVTTANTCATPVPETERLAVVSVRVEAGCRYVEDGLANPNPQRPGQRVPFDLIVARLVGLVAI